MIKAIWKRLRRPLRALNFSNLNHASDPLDYIAFEWDLNGAVEGLCEEIVAGTYQPAAAEIVRSAKTTGLTRPLAFLRPRDQLLYRVITLRAENSLLATSYPWTRFGRGNAEDEQSSTGESGWFRAWLERQDQIWVINENHAYLVETDISNFFPSIDTRAVSQHVLVNSLLDQDVVSLLEHMLKRFARNRAYRAMGVGGLPQEPFDGSRLLAHTYLRPVDAEFAVEGNNHQYSRWVDDIVIGANSRKEALTQIRRAQLALEGLGLYPNGAKTRILRAADFAVDYMKFENDVLGEIAEDFKAGVDVTRRFGSALARHLKLKQPKPKAWERVLRRMYTTARTLDDDRLVPWWVRHLKEYPGSADHVFEYMATHRLTLQRAQALRVALLDLAGVYDDIELLARHYVVVAPNLDSALLREFLSDWALHTIELALEKQPRLAGASALIVGKFGEASHFDALERLFRNRMKRDDPCRQQTVVVLASRARLTERDLRRLLGRSSVEGTQHLEFVLAMLANDPGALNRAMATMSPSPRENPRRAMMRPRSLQLAPLLNSISPGNWPKARARHLADLQGNRLRLRDLAAERVLQT
jgi:hypothetical protein